MKKLLIGVIAVLLLIGITFQFLLTWHKMENKTMEATIEKGDLVWINKVAVGAWFLGMKLPGLCQIERNDIIYFAYPEQFDTPLYNKKRFVSRVVALPGDRLQILRKELYLNKKFVEYPDSAQLGYRMIMKTGTPKEEFFQKYDIDQVKPIIDSMGIYQVPLTAKKVEAIREKPEVDYIRMVKQLRGGANRIWPKSQYRSWSEDDFGPLIIPKAGDIIKLTYRNYDIYKNIIVTFEGNEVMKHKGEIFINGKRSNSYTIQKNYYFVLDDNRDRFFDSREFGFVPQEYILGKVIGFK